tara:strand:- start:4743 stop:6704 length:1962 start_codon:yes stop_codon:yes gene_type:complete
LNQAAAKFRPRKSVATAQWLTEHYHLPEAIGDLAGTYDFHYAPYFLGVAAALDDPAVGEVDLMKAAQIGWTYFLIGYLAKRVEAHPAPIMVLFAKEKDGKAFHDEKLCPAFEASPILRGLIDVSTSRKAGNRWDLKSYPGGFLKLVGSNSPGNVKSTSSVGVGVIEEPDDTSDDVKQQGTAIGLLEERLKRYLGSKLIVGGTPTIRDLSKTEHRIKQSDCRVLPVVCHECGDAHVLAWENVSWLDADDDSPEHEVFGRALPDTAVYGCPHCGAAWDDDQRQRNVRDTVFNAVAAGDPLCGWTPTQPFHGSAGFMELSELYACVPGTTLADVVRDHLTAEYQAHKGDLSGKITFTNQKLGRTYAYETATPDAEVLRERAEDYREFWVPLGGLIITVGVDVQRDRLAVVMRAWGRGMESWLLYWGELYAKVSTTDSSDPVWKELDDLLATPIQSEAGHRLLPRAVSIDSGGHSTEQVYEFVRTRQSRGVRAIKGSSNDYGRREIFSAPKKTDYKGKRQTKASKFGLLVYQVGTHKAKDLLFGEGGRLSLRGSGPGRMHWYQDVRDDYYEQLTGVIKAPSARFSGKLIWHDKPGQPVEAADCEIYALHAAYSLRLHTWKDDRWDEYESQLKQGDMFGGKEPAAAAPPRRRKSSYWN